MYRSHRISSGIAMAYGLHVMRRLTAGTLMYVKKFL